MERSDDGLLAVGKGMRFFILIVALALSYISWPLSWAGDSSTNLNKDRYSSKDRVYVSVADSDQNKVPSAVETVRAMVFVWKYAGPDGQLSDSETVVLTETGPNSGVFVNTTGLLITPASSKPRDGRLHAMPGEVIEAPG